VPNGSVTGNNKIWRKFTFSAISTNKIRVLTSASVDGYSRITEVEAYGPQASSCQPIARLDPLNASGGGGENPLSQNFNWNLPLVSLPGRAGLDLNLALSYNSLVWTKNGNNISFNDDNGFPSAGFRLGFPVIQQMHYNGETGKYGFLLLSPDGSRTELRQVGSSVLFEAADSSLLLLDTTDLTLRTTDGTQLSYVLMGNQLNCTKIKDRNGNYIPSITSPIGPTRWSTRWEGRSNSTTTEPVCSSQSRKPGTTDSRMRPSTLGPNSRTPTLLSKRTSAV
jgi:hypothetical protein